jgi:hypothetical protein
MLSRALDYENLNFNDCNGGFNEPTNNESFSRYEGVK